MNQTNIYNAKIVKAWLIKEYDGMPIELKLEVKSTVGSAVMSFDLSKIEKIFNILNITNFDNIINSPCIVLIHKGIMKDIGKFLFHHYDGRPFTEEDKDWVFNDTLRKEIYNYVD